MSGKPETKGHDGCNKNGVRIVGQEDTEEEEEKEGTNDVYAMPWASVTKDYDFAQRQFLDVLLALSSPANRQDLITRLLVDPGHVLTAAFLSPSNPSRWRYAGASDAAFQKIVEEEETVLKRRTAGYKDRLVCRGCGVAGKVTYRCKQHRAADEPPTYFFTCNGCGTQWREG